MKIAYQKKISLNKTKIIFLLSNLFFFLTILSTYLDLRSFKISDTILPTQFSFVTYSLIVIFLINLFFIYFINRKNVHVNFNIFVYYLIASSGLYVINFPIMDELVLIVSSSFFCLTFILKKKIPCHKTSIYFLVLLSILLIQSFIGLSHDLKSIRYIILYSSLIFSFLYFSHVIEIDENKQKTFFNYIFWGIIVYVFYNIFFWYLKFYIFEMKFGEQEFIGHMQPSFAKSSSGHFDAIHVLSSLIILYYTFRGEFFYRRLTLFIAMILFWILADSRSTLFLILSLILFYFLSIKSYKKIIFVMILSIIFSQKDYFDNYLNHRITGIQNAVTRSLDFKKGTVEAGAALKLDYGEYFYKERIAPAYQDFGRFSYIIGGIYSMKYNFHKIFFGCGFYGYYVCAEKGLKEVYKDNNVPFVQSKKGMFGTKTRPPAAGTILIENGLFIILFGIIYYLNFIKKNIHIYRNKFIIKYNQIIISLYLMSTITIFSIFSNLLDTVFFYLFLMPLFLKYIFSKLKNNIDTS